MSGRDFFWDSGERTSELAETVIVSGGQNRRGGFVQVNLYMTNLEATQATNGAILSYLSWTDRATTLVVQKQTVNVNPAVLGSTANTFPVDTLPNTSITIRTVYDPTVTNALTSYQLKFWGYKL